MTNFLIPNELGVKSILEKELSIRKLKYKVQFSESNRTSTYYINASESTVEALYNFIKDMGLDIDYGTCFTKFEDL